MRTEGLWERWSITGLVCRRALLWMEAWLAGADDWSLTTVALRRWSCWAVTSIRAMSLSRRHLARLIEPYSSAYFSAAARLAALDAGEDGFVPYGCIVSEGKVPAVVGTGEVPVFAIIAPELLEGIGSPLRELLGSVCAAA